MGEVGASKYNRWALSFLETTNRSSPDPSNPAVAGTHSYPMTLFEVTDKFPFYLRIPSPHFISGLVFWFGILYPEHILF